MHKKQTSSETSFLDVSEFAAVAISDDQLTPWPRVAAVSALVAFSLPTFITGLEISQGLPPISLETKARVS